MVVVVRGLGSAIKNPMFHRPFFWHPPRAVGADTLRYYDYRSPPSSILSLSLSIKEKNFFLFWDTRVYIFIVGRGTAGLGIWLIRHYVWKDGQDIK